MNCGETNQLSCVFDLYPCVYLPKALVAYLLGREMGEITITATSRPKPPVIS